VPKRFKPGAGKTEWFKDHEHGPEMVVIPSGTFVMGSSDTEPRHQADEWPQHQVSITQPFAMARKAVTRGEFSAFLKHTSYQVDDGAHVWTGMESKFDPGASWRDPGFEQDDNHPVVCVNWNDASAYVAWLSDLSGKTYRLPSEADREYATRAGTTTPFWWGPAITPKQANYNGNFTYANSGGKGEYRKATVPVD
jgi:formylglycine-generating enzyme required for sulfatase activity